MTQQKLQTALSVGATLVRTVMDDTRLVSLHPAFVRHVKRAGVYSEQLIQRVAAQESIQGLADIPEPIRFIDEDEVVSAGPPAKH